MQQCREMSLPDKQWHDTWRLEVCNDRVVISRGRKPLDTDVIWSNGYQSSLCTHNICSLAALMRLVYIYNCFLSNFQNRFSYPPQYFERRPWGCRACERCTGDLCERIDSYWDVTRAKDWGSTSISEFWSAVSRNGEYFSSSKLIGEYSSFALTSCNLHHLLHMSWVLAYCPCLVWSQRKTFMWDTTQSNF